METVRLLILPDLKMADGKTPIVSMQTQQIIRKCPRARSFLLVDCYHLSLTMHLFFITSDICYVDHERSPQANHVAGGFTIFEGDVEGDTHCHGFVWSDDETSTDFRYKANTLFYVSMRDHLKN